MKTECGSVLIEGMVAEDPFGGRYEDRVAVYPAATWAEMATVPSAVWQVARGDVDDNAITAHDCCRWLIRRFEAE